MSEIEVFRDESPTDSSDPPAAVQSTSDPQDNSTEPVAAIRGRQPSRTTAANASKAATTFSSLLTRSISRKLDRGRNPSSSHQRRRHYPTTFKQVRSPRPLQFSPVRGISKFLPSTRISDHSKQEPQITLLAARPNLHSLKDRPATAGRPSASLGRAPDTAALSPHLPRASTERQLATQPSEVSAFASTSRLTRTSTPPSAAYSYTQPRTNEPLPYPWPAAPPLTASPTPSAQAPAPVYPPPPLPPPPLSVHQALSGSNLPQSSTQTPAIPPLPRSQLRPRSPLFSTTTSPLPIPPNALALEPPPVANSIRSIRSQILSEIQNIGTGGGSLPTPVPPFSELIFPWNLSSKPPSIQFSKQSPQGPSSHTWQHGKASKLFTPLITCHSPPFHYWPSPHSSPTST